MKPTTWQAKVLYPSNRLVNVEFLCESNIREDAENTCRALVGCDDVRQWSRVWD